MKTNAEAKQEAIKAAWESLGIDFKSIQDNLDENGWHLGDVDLLNDDVYNKCDHYSKSLGKMCERPKSLRGMENNAGWTRIEPDGSNLPERSFTKGWKVCNFNTGEITRVNSNGVRYYFKKGIATHYKPIQEEPKPLY